jgi:SPP1 gp7 family putative phage head morphogenesis protein
MAAPAVVRVAQRFKAELLAGETQHQYEMARRYLAVERALSDKIAALSEQVARLSSQGRPVAVGMVYRLERWQELERQILAELASFNGWALEAIAARQAELGRVGVEAAQAMLDVAGIRVAYDRLPVDAVVQMAGFAGDGSPLSVLLSEAYPATVDAIGQALVNGVALGQNPKLVARAMRDAAGIGLDRAFLVARTEELRAFRTATQAQYAAAGVTTYQRVSARDDRVCIGCLAADGEVFETEQSFDDHPACRCVAVCILPGENRAFQSTNESWFNAQDAATQTHIMGPGRLEAYESGAASWSDLWTRTDDPVWGGAIVPTPVSALPTS